MKCMLRISAAVLAVGMIGSANAADSKVKAPIYKAAPPAATTWQGFYLGGHAGYIWSQTDVFDTGVLVESNARTNGIIGGVLAGYNLQVSNLVLGLEGDFGWSDAHGTGITSLITPNTYDIDWTGHLRGRIGVAPGPYPVLLFLAGGAAFSRFDFKSGETGESTSTNYTGASIGGGLDFAAGNQFILRAEWLHDFYNSGLARIGDYMAKLKDTDTARAAFIFKFN